MRRGLLDWLAAPSSDHGIRFARDDGGWDLWTYERLAGQVSGMVELLSAEKVQRGHVVSLGLPSGPDFLAAFVGVLGIGAIPAPLPLRMLFEEEQAYAQRTASLLTTVGGMVLSSEKLVAPVERAARLARLDRRPLVLREIEPSKRVVAPRASTLAFVQFTSGSSGSSRAVAVTEANLRANMDAIVSWVGWEPECAGAHWLPVHHDMGLVAGLLTPVCEQRDVWIMRPEQFVRDPMRWIARFGCGDAALTTAPSFGYAYCAARLSAEDLEGCDFSAWRAAVVGAERVDPAALSRFSDLLGPFGFRPETFLPGYGLAECTLAATGARRGRKPRLARVDWTRTAFAGRVHIEDRAALGERQLDEEDPWLTACGPALDDVEVRILNEQGDPLPVGHLGEIEVGGASVSAGYLDGNAHAQTSFQSGRVRTGDAGFFADGELFVTGRIADALKVRGRMLHAEDLEKRLGEIDGIRRDRCVVVAGICDGRPTIVAIVAAQPGEWVHRALRLLDREAGDAADIQVRVGRRNGIMRTTSGKPRRRVMWQALLEGQLEGEPVGELRRRARPVLSARP